MKTNRRRRWLTGGAVAAAMVGILATGVTYAHQPGGQGQQGQAQSQRPGRARGMGMGPGLMLSDGGPMGMVRLALGRLGLSPEQKQQVRTIVGNHKAEFQGIQDRAIPARRALADAIAAGDEAAIRQRSADLSAVQTETALLAAKVHGEIFKILTPEQQQKAQELRKQFESRMDQRRGRGARRGSDN